ncbi:hypothetical protein HRK28_14140 [Rathayibacter sp. VKM Ac-2835]|uniref:hypothetical protein n=1 Tax=Rathayibacter sp. VKM Ac-2835 TaxID=2739043 RepID=UPI001562FDFE|nr:hypothetical protein [Rathayibacter sp. VKM Ac-2835]NRG42052.1 hypothetical protein [Rathayibacter sp. VKM Ac-2835]
MADLFELRKSPRHLLASSVHEAVSVQSGELCWVSRGHRSLCQIWDQDDYWEISFDEKATGRVLDILGDLDRRRFRLVGLRVAGVTIGSWVETEEGLPLVYELARPGVRERRGLGRCVVLSTFG